MTAILIVEDDASMRMFLADNLLADGYSVRVADGVASALDLIDEGNFDLALVDVGLPDGSGLELITRIRAQTGPGARYDGGMPLMLVSGLAGESDRVRGFERGADDVVVKPFSYLELRLRIAAVLRRAAERRPVRKLRVADLEIDQHNHLVHLGGARVMLSSKEFALLARLATEPTRVWTKTELLRDVWGFRTRGTTRTLDSHACRLRRKLGSGYVVTVWGVGYRLLDGAVDVATGTATAQALELEPA